MTENDPTPTPPPAENGDASTTSSDAGTFPAPADNPRDTGRFKGYCRTLARFVGETTDSRAKAVKSGKSAGGIDVVGVRV